MSRLDVSGMNMSKKKWADVLTVISGKNQKAVVNPNGKYPIYGSGGIMGYADDFLCEAGTTIVGRKGTINKPIFVTERFWNVDTAFGISPGPELNPKYLFYFCRHFNFKELDKSTTIPSLAKRDLLAIDIPLPSLDEQKRIVSRIEELFSELDNGVETLQKTKRQLAVYRQAVYHDVINSYKNEKYILSDLVSTIEGDRGKNYPKREEFQSSGYCLFLTAQNVRPYGWKFEENTFISEDKDRVLRSGKLQRNDIVITTRGTLGNIAVYDESVPYENVRVNSCMLILRIDSDKVSPYYLASFLMSPVFKAQIDRLKSGTAQPQIPANILRNTLISIPSIRDQEKIIKELSQRFSVCDSIEKTVDTALQQAEAMRQSILKQAFEGRL